jgi:hypothetical protein
VDGWTRNPPLVPPPPPRPEVHLVRLTARPSAPPEVRLREELDAIARRAHEARVRLLLGEAKTGITALCDIENRCRDALAALDDSVPPTQD